jgi:phosphatidylserine synthase
MVSTIRFRSFKTINVGWAPTYMGPLMFALLLACIAARPDYTLLALAYGYLLSGFIGLAISRLRPRRTEPPAAG